MRMARTVWCCFSVFLQNLVFAAASDRFSRSTTFTHITSQNISAIALGDAWPERSLLSCVAGCRSRYTHCNSVTFNPQTGMCTPGSWAALGSYSLSPAQSELFYGRLCDSGFTLYQYKSIVECLYLPAGNAQFLDARNICASKNSYVYMAKMQEQLELLITLAKKFSIYSGAPTYTGLTDLVTEGQFVWEDGEFLDPVWQSQSFYPGQPDNSNGMEHCIKVGSFSNYLQLYDGACTNNNLFICARST